MDRETIWPERDIVRLGHGISDWQEWVRVLTSYSLTPTRVTHSVTGNESLCQKTRCASLPERWNLSSRDRETAIGSSRIILVIAYSLPRLIIESAPNSGDCHVTQIRTCCRCCYHTGCGDFSADIGLCVVRRLARWWMERWLARRMAARVESGLGPRVVVASRLGLGLGWTSLCRGGASIRGRVRRPAPCARPVGPALDSREPVLVKNRPERLTRGTQV